MNVSIRCRGVAMLLTGSLYIQVPGQSDIRHMLGDVVHFFSALLLASVPIGGYWLLYKRIAKRKSRLFFRRSVYGSYQFLGT
ncbi:MAG: hypothetical protein H6750_20550 [Nitrospiraceae bacterium]|nr:hypothetical protein [Nitrospiraceae bacterium]